MIHWHNPLLNMLSYPVYYTEFDLDHLHYETQLITKPIYISRMSHFQNPELFDFTLYKLLAQRILCTIHNTKDNVESRTSTKKKQIKNKIIFHNSYTKSYWFILYVCMPIVKTFFLRISLRSLRLSFPSTTSHFLIANLYKYNIYYVLYTYRIYWTKK